MFSGKVRDVDERYQVSEITRSALATAKQTPTNTGSVILSNRYVPTGASWISSALGKVVKESEDVSMKTGEKVDKAEEERKENILHLGTRDATHGHDRLQGARKELLPATSLAASRGGGADRRGGHPLAGQLLAGKGSHRLRKGGDDSVVRVREEATTSF
ncbi:hypothetical protein GW17_00024372 [Ensete ventricosum]|nr:hypothetical protein GW17_00024372 [Ensete ventricosum]